MEMFPSPFAALVHVFCRERHQGSARSAWLRLLRLPGWAREQKARLMRNADGSSPPTTEITIMATTYNETVVHRGHRASALFVPFPFVCFTLALITDILFWRTANLMWQNFSAWLLFAGGVFGGLAVLTGLFDWLRPASRRLMPGIAASIGFIIMLLISVVNSLIHAGDGWTAVVPNGLIASALTMLVMIVTLVLAARRPVIYRRVS
ncbi:DUF2231 domain-containing protein [Allorhizobium pseudoryzae]|uniref:DUF2231 domain-containing protein n=1 Tax=Allorhizobium pseudoryzae TaxID=379684 RepID=UPI003D08998B